VNRIGDHALIGDCHSLALVGKDGSIEWACFPRFDSPAVFASILDERRGGSFRVSPAPAPARHRPTSQRWYLEDTNVLVTKFETSTGVLEVTDFMPTGHDPSASPTSVRSHHGIIRRARCTAGEVDVAIEVAPRFEYATFVPRFVAISAVSAEVVGGADALWVECTRPISGDGERLFGDWALASGEEAWVATFWYPSQTRMTASPVRARDFPALLEETAQFWREWMGNCTYAGLHSREVRRSALVLKALTYAPSGAVVAAGTTSLPESIGAGRNWDYRYTWIRDATLTFTALFTLGFVDEATAFKQWLERSSAGRPQDLQIMYGICGERRLTETVLDHLTGHRGSSPVRIGNGAADQTQLDSFGQILQAAHLFSFAGGELTADNWRFLSGLADSAARRWAEPDNGIWEMRDEPRHFLHSKAHCWMALDRSIKLADRVGTRGAGWHGEREKILRFILSEGERTGSFRQAAGHDTLDASALVLPAIGLVPTTAPVVLRTIDDVRAGLETDGLVYRYVSADGLEGGEGAFLLCSFWLLDCLIFAGRLDEAELLLERLLQLGNDVGLYAEEVDPSTGEALGNFPQAFTHMALVTSCTHIEAARRGAIPNDGAFDYAELAVARLLVEKGALFRARDD
jgi:GH15 family glucan-1,4-alpha-glucosidase